MLLVTTIPPNADGFVMPEFGKVSYKFLPNEEGDLVAEVDNDGHVAHLLGTGNFYPHDEADFQAATDIIGDQDDREEDEEEDFEGEGETEPDAAPLEALTPRSNRKPRKAQAE